MRYFMVKNHKENIFASKLDMLKLKYVILN